MFRLTVLAACLCASASLAAEPVRLALPGLAGIQASPEVSGFYSEHLARQLNIQGMREPAPEVPAPQSVTGECQETETSGEWGFPFNRPFAPGQRIAESSKRPDVATRNIWLLHEEG